MTNLDNQPKCPIQITPAIDGKCVWLTTSMFQFRPTLGFPAGAKYDIEIPAGIETISGDRTKNSKSFEIVTPEFRIIQNDGYASYFHPDEYGHVSPAERRQIEAENQKHFFDRVFDWNPKNPIEIAFNDEVDLATLKKYLTIKPSLGELDIAYAVDESTLKPVHARVEILPKAGAWPYDTEFTLSIGKAMASKRGFIEMKQGYSQKFHISPFLFSERSFILKNPKAKNRFSYQNMRHATKHDIIGEKDVFIQFKFAKDVPLDKKLFQTNVPFDLSYGKPPYRDEDDKTTVMMQLQGDIRTHLSVLVRNSQVEPTAKDTVARFRVPEKKTAILGYEMLDYKRACLETSE